MLMGGGSILKLSAEFSHCPELSLDSQLWQLWRGGLKGSVGHFASDH